MNSAEKMLKSIFASRGLTKDHADIPLLLMSYLGIHYATKICEDMMELRKEIEVEGYVFAVGVRDNSTYEVGLLTWPGIKGFTSDELRKYRYVMLQAQHEISKMQADIDRVLQQSLLD